MNDASGTLVILGQSVAAANGDEQISATWAGIGFPAGSLFISRPPLGGFQLLQMRDDRRRTPQWPNAQRDRAGESPGVRPRAKTLRARAEQSVQVRASQRRRRIEQSVG
jgi:hypothetical protein